MCVACDARLTPTASLTELPPASITDNIPYGSSHSVTAPTALLLLIFIRHYLTFKDVTVQRLSGSSTKDTLCLLSLMACASLFCATFKLLRKMFTLAFFAFANTRDAQVR
jgi:hypothetical protein